MAANAARFAAHDILDVQRVSAIDGNADPLPHHWIHTPARMAACSVTCVRSRSARCGLRSVLIFEDDACSIRSSKKSFATFIQELPDDWDMLFLGALHKDEPSESTEHIARITKANSTFAYAIRNTVFDAFIELNSRAEHVLDMNNYVLQERSTATASCQSRLGRIGVFRRSAASREPLVSREIAGPLWGSHRPTVEPN
jgi:hypothetical protein